ncbi:hypothetical protein E2C01_038623 [Portunus trituberculatus]|uniref:Uncharacterized protein n=1 Tax=Portunus trituberculatus TaxID=210409 RepID=A0A5B7FCP3_PORTR|nr:hypothetical protein [Portunus trituberculatus]
MASERERASLEKTDVNQRKRERPKHPFSVTSKRYVPLIIMVTRGILMAVYDIFSWEGCMHSKGSTLIFNGHDFCRTQIMYLEKIMCHPSC